MDGHREDTQTMAMRKAGREQQHVKTSTLPRLATEIVDKSVGVDVPPLLSSIAFSRGYFLNSRFGRTYTAKLTYTAHCAAIFVFHWPLCPPSDGVISVRLRAVSLCNRASS